MTKYLKVLAGLLARVFLVSIPAIVFSQFRAEMSQPLSDWSWDVRGYVFGSLLALVAFDYMKDYAKSSLEKKKRHPLQAACRQSTATISSILEAARFDQASHRPIIESALKQIEEIVEIGLAKSKADGLEISANCMIYSTQRGIGGRLQLLYWGTRLAGREPIELRIDSDLPGAIQAVKSGVVTYVHDTQKSPVVDFFKGKAYRSIVSIPIKKGGRVICVVNIDATEPGAFKDESGFVNRVMPLFSGQIEVIKKIAK